MVANQSVRELFILLNSALGLVKSSLKESDVFVWESKEKHAMLFFEVDVTDIRFLPPFNVSLNVLAQGK